MENAAKREEHFNQYHIEQAFRWKENKLSRRG